MTTFDIYRRDTGGMLNNELAKILQADREREIEGQLRNRRFLAKAKNTVTERGSRVVQSAQFTDQLQPAPRRGTALRSSPRA